MSASKFDTAPAEKVAHVRPLWGLARKVAPRHTALVVIDMQNDFVAEGGLMHREGWDVSASQDVAARLPVLISAARKAGVLIIFVRNVYTTGGNFYLSEVWLEQMARARKRPVGAVAAPVFESGGFCGADSWGGEFYGEVQPEHGDPVVTKHRYNGFHNTDLDTILRAHGIRTVVFSGVSTHCCVESTAREAFMRDYYVVPVKDGTAAYSPEDHESALRTLDRLFGEVSSIDVLSAIWAACGANPIDNP